MKMSPTVIAKLKKTATYGLMYGGLPARQPLREIRRRLGARRWATVCRRLRRLVRGSGVERHALVKFCWRGGR